VIGLFLLAAAGVAYWAWKTHDGQALRIGDVAAVVAGLIGLKLLRSESALALLALGGAGWWFWFRRGGARVETMDDVAARSLLELPRGATPEEIRAAHRRLVARVHPDVGGSADLTRRVNAARDLLLRRGTNP
jgi:DnaJ homolog subfamily C member 19